jgi:subtilase family serine protease
MLLVVLVLALFAATCQGGRLVIGNKARCTQCHTHKSKSAGSVWKEVLFVVKNKHDWKELESELYKVSLPDSPSYGQHWTKQQVDEYIRNDAGTNAVRAYLAKHDIEEIVEKSTSNGIYITAKASISTWETLLSASFHEYDNINDKGRSIHLADSFEMPDELEPYVETILKTVQFNGEVRKHGKINNRYGTNADLDANIFKGLESSTKQKQLKNDVPFVNSRDYRERIKKESKATRRRQMTERIEKARSLRADFLNSPNYRKGMDVDAHLKRTLFDIDGKVTPAFLWYYLNVNVSSATGVGTTNTSMEVFETSQQNYSPDDLKQFQQKFGAPIQPVSKYLGEGNYDQSSTCDDLFTADNCYEANLDIQYIMAVSWYTPAYYDYDNSDVPFVDWSIAMNERNDTDLATLTSISYGIPEMYMSDDQMSTFATEMIKLGLRGATVFNSAGDNGANGDTQKTTCNNVEALPNFPSGCPYVVSVGATQGPEAGKKEVVCSTDNPQEYGGPSAITSGGGFSNFFARPWWQDTAVSEYFKNVPVQPKAGSYNTSGRGYPDISTLGNSYQIVVGGQVTGVDGTSCSSPVTTALFSIISGHRVAKGLPKLGWITPLLYYPVAAQTYFAHDITIGNNKCTESEYYSTHCCETGFYASSGWDPTTGIGSPKFAELYDYFIRLNFTSTNNTDYKNQTFPLDRVPTTGPTYAPTPVPTAATSPPTPETITMSV